LVAARLAPGSAGGGNRPLRRGPPLCEGWRSNRLSERLQQRWAAVRGAMEREKIDALTAVFPTASSATII